MSTSDRELLELAARAAGFDICHVLGCGGHFHGLMVYMDRGEGSYGQSWNPLTDDGDALRLAFTIARRHKVDFNIHIFGAGVKTGSQMAKNRGSFINEGDLSSVRRSIVETAAQIGKDIS